MKGRQAPLTDRVAAIRLERRLDASDSRAAYLAIVPNGAHVRLSPEAFRLIDTIKSGNSLEDLAAALNVRANRRRLTVDELRAATLRVIEYLERIASGPPGTPAGFWATRPLMPASLVTWVAERLGWLYAWPAIVIAGAIVAWSLASAQPGWFSLAATDGALAGGYGLFLISLVVHEFGHAAACRRFGLAPGAVGFTMYLLFPALYTDVTRSWRLSRGKRIVVDLGGNYFQALVGAAYLSTFGVTGSPAFSVASSLVALGMLFSLNPIFKCDGYWIVTDALGVTNLSGQPRVLARGLVGRLRDGVPWMFPWPKPVVAALMLYSGLTVGVWLWFITRLAPMLAARFTSPGSQFAAVAGAIQNQGVGLWQACLGLATSLFLLIASAVMIMRLGQAIAPAFLKARLTALATGVLAAGRRRNGIARRLEPS